MGWPVSLAGIALVMLAMTDIFVTALTLRGAGPVTGRLTAWLWRAARWVLARPTPRPALSLAGPAIAAATVGNWLLMLWVGWTLVFLGGEGNVVLDSDDSPADAWTKAYFAGYTLSTLGLGDVRPAGTVWQFATALASVNGFLAVSMAATYLIPVVTAAARQRQLAIYVHGLGDTPAGIILAGWNGKDLSALDAHLAALAPMVIDAGQQHLVYPVLYCFHGVSETTSFSVRLTALDEALLVLRHGVAAPARPVEVVTKPLAEGVTSLLERMRAASIPPMAEAPPPPGLEPLRRAGIPTVSDAEFAAIVAAQDDRRRHLWAVVADAGWTWDRVFSEPEPDCLESK